MQMIIFTEKKLSVYFNISNNLDSFFRSDVNKTCDTQNIHNNLKKLFSNLSIECFQTEYSRKFNNKK